jgi:hypothetical protein
MPDSNGISPPIPDQSAWWAGTKAFFGSLATSVYDLGNHLTFGKVLDSERYNDQVNAQGERLYNVAKNLGYSDNSIANGAGLAQALAGEVVGTNNLAEAVAGYDLGTNTMLDGWERVEKAASGVAQVAGTLAGAFKATGINPRITGKTPTQTPVGCFLAGTLVSRYNPQNQDEKEFIPIEQIKEYDKVWSCDSLSGRWQPKTVLEVLTHLYTGDIITIETDDGIIETTGGHPIWVKSGNDLEHRPRCEHIYEDEHEMQPHGRWVNARDLQAGDELISRSCSSHVLHIQSHSEITTVYNITVADYHTYAVGSGEVLVHNKAMKNRLASDDDFGFTPKRQSQNKNMDPKHVWDKKTMDSLARKYGWSKDKRQKFHQYIDGLKEKGETLSWNELDELARDF